MNYKELASKIRGKFPGQYDDLDDKTLAQKVVQKHPEYSDTTFEQPAKSDYDLVTSGKSSGDLPRDLAQLATMPKRGLRGLGVGIERMIANPKNPSDAILRAAEAVKPDYIPQKGEKLGSFAGTASDPVTLALAMSGGAPFEAGSLGAALSSGATVGAGGTILDQLASGKDVSGKQVISDAAVNALLSGALHLPSTKIFPKIASALSGTPAQDFERNARDVRLKLPESLGGATSEENAGKIYEDSLRKAGVNPEDLKFDKYNNNKGNKKLFVQQVEKDLDRKLSGESGVKVSTSDLIKANRHINDLIESLPEEAQAEKRAWMETKSKVKNEIKSRGDDLAEAFNKYSRAKTKTNLSKVIPDSKFLARRAALSGAAAMAYGKPAGLASLGAMSPSLLSTIQTISNLVPSSAKTGAAASTVDLLRQLRKRLQKQDSEK